MNRRIRFLYSLDRTGQAALRQHGIFWTYDLLDRWFGSAPADRAEIAATLALDPERLARAAAEADLLRVPTLMPADAGRLSAAGITGPEHLAAASAPELWSALAATKAGGRAISLGRVRRLISAAAATAPYVAGSRREEIDFRTELAVRNAEERPVSRLVARTGAIGMLASILAISLIVVGPAARAWSDRRLAARSGDPFELLYADTQWVVRRASLEIVGYTIGSMLVGAMLLLVGWSLWSRWTGERLPLLLFRTRSSQNYLLARWDRRRLPSIKRAVHGGLALYVVLLAIATLLVLRNLPDLRPAEVTIYVGVLVISLLVTAPGAIEAWRAARQRIRYELRAIKTYILYQLIVTLGGLVAIITLASGMIPGVAAIDRAAADHVFAAREAAAVEALAARARMLPDTLPELSDLKSRMVHELESEVPRRMVTLVALARWERADGTRFEQSILVPILHAGLAVMLVPLAIFVLTSLLLPGRQPAGLLTFTMFLTGFLLNRGIGRALSAVLRHPPQALLLISVGLFGWALSLVLDFAQTLVLAKPADCPRCSAEVGSRDRFCRMCAAPLFHGGAALRTAPRRNLC